MHSAHLTVARAVLGFIQVSQYKQGSEAHTDSNDGNGAQCVTSIQQSFNPFLPQRVAAYRCSSRIDFAQLKTQCLKQMVRSEKIAGTVLQPSLLKHGCPKWRQRRSAWVGTMMHTPNSLFMSVDSTQPTNHNDARLVHCGARFNCHGADFHLLDPLPHMRRRTLYNLC
jgi:hypothetical protein